MATFTCFHATNADERFECKDYEAAASYPKANKWAGKILPRTKPEIKTFHKKFKLFSQFSRIPIVNHG